MSLPTTNKTTPKSKAKKPNCFFTRTPTGRFKLAHNKGDCVWIDPTAKTKVVGDDGKVKPANLLKTIFNEGYGTKPSEEQSANALNG